MRTFSNSQQFELVTHRTFNVKTTHELTDAYLTAVKQTICKTLCATWIDLKPLDNVTVRVNIETTDNLTNVSETITTLIQKGTMYT